MSMSDLVKYEDFMTVTPGDTRLLADGLFVGGSGNINIQTKYGTELISGVVGGSILPFHCVKVLSASTTATNIKALWANRRPDHLIS